MKRWTSHKNVSVMHEDNDGVYVLYEDVKQLEDALKILDEYKVKKDIDGRYSLSKGIYSIASFGKDFNKEARELKKALEK